MIMLKSDLHPPIKGPGSDPVLYGVATGLAQLFPLVIEPADRDARKGPDGDREPPPRED